ncbi:hypothetical protein DFH06DRAFT_1472974 [Mycena polygramma]|nr:hypothetical protein DFH06DRAFT_1472974 [Mycena polygramma]
MSPALVHRSSTRSHADIHVLSARSAVVTSLNGWQIFGIAIIVIVLALLIGGWFWYQKRSAASARRAHPTNPGITADDSAGGNINSKGTITTAEGQDVGLHDLARPLSWISHHGTGPAHPPHLAQPNSNSNANPNSNSNVPWPTADSNALRLENMVRADADGSDSAVAMTLGSPGAMTGAEKAGLVPAASGVENSGSVVGGEVVHVSDPGEGGKSPPSPTTKAAPPPAPSKKLDAPGFESAPPSSPSPPPAPPPIKQEGSS